MREAGTMEQVTERPTRRAIQSYRDIEAFQRSMSLLAPLHRLIAKLPASENWELASQLRRSSKSIPANISEGYGKKRSARDFKSYLDTALGSANETIVHLEIGVAVGYFTDEEIRPLVEGYEIVAKQLYRLIASWQDFSKGNRS
jgi:four helix bundle protein